MEYHEAVKHLAPCGLDCMRCAGCESGEIRQLSARLLELLGNYKTLAKVRAEHQPVFDGYDHFEGILQEFSNAACSGCRGSNVLCPVTMCPAQACHKEKQVEFCFQCDEYPCKKEFAPRLAERWRKLNDRMKEIGVIEYYQEEIQKPRY